MCIEHYLIFCAIKILYFIIYYYLLLSHGYCYTIAEYIFVCRRIDIFVLFYAFLIFKCFYYLSMFYYMALPFILSKCVLYYVSCMEHILINTMTNDAIRSWDIQLTLCNDDLIIQLETNIALVSSRCYTHTLKLDMVCI